MKPWSPRDLPGLVTWLRVGPTGIIHMEGQPLVFGGDPSPRVNVPVEKPVELEEVEK